MTRSRQQRQAKRRRQMANTRKRRAKHIKKWRNHPLHKHRGRRV